MGASDESEYDAADGRSDKFDGGEEEAVHEEAALPPPPSCPITEVDGLQLRRSGKFATGYRGVTRKGPGKFQAKMSYGAGKGSLDLGLYDTVLDAAVAVARHLEEQTEAPPPPRRAAAEAPAIGGEEVCVTCGSGQPDDCMLLCDGFVNGGHCPTAQHTFCCNPPLESVPTGDWFCESCTARRAARADEASGQESGDVPDGEEDEASGEDAEAEEGGGHQPKRRRVASERAQEASELAAAMAAADPDAPKSRNRKCGECPACLVRTDCGTCSNCLDMPKFGGPGKKRQTCKLRKCHALKKSAAAAASAARRIERSPGASGSPAAKSPKQPEVYSEPSGIKWRLTVRHEARRAYFAPEVGPDGGEPASATWSDPDGGDTDSEAEAEAEAALHASDGGGGEGGGGEGGGGEGGASAAAEAPGQFVEDFCVRCGGGDSYATLRLEIAFDL